MDRSQSDSMLNGAQTISLWAPTRQFSTTYMDQTARLAQTLSDRRPARSIGRMTPTATMDVRLINKRRPAGVDPMEKAGDEFPPLAVSCDRKADDGFDKWTKYTPSVVPNYPYRSFSHTELPMNTKEGAFVPYTPYNMERGAKDCRPSCFEFRAGYRHSDYPLTKMSTSITNLPHNKKYWTNVHPKEIELGRQWQWTFRDCYVGRESCRTFREMQGYPQEGEKPAVGPGSGA